MWIPVKLPTYIWWQQVCACYTSMPSSVLKKKYLKYCLSFCLRRSSRGCMTYSIFAYWFKSWWHGNKVSAWRNEKNKVFILSVALCGMISSRGVQYLYHLPRFCWQYFFQGGLDNIMRIRHPMLLNHRFNHLPMKGEFHLKEYILVHCKSIIGIFVLRGVFQYDRYLTYFHIKW